MMPASIQPPVAQTPEIDALLAAGAVCAIGVSGGRDSQACALATHEYLNAIGHTGPRVLIHADLGRVEWRDSLPVCERLAAYLNYELLIARRAAGDMLARWQGRWAANLGRYRQLECVKLVLPWSTPSMRFCTSELKSAPISSKLRKRFPGLPIVSATGVRREESAARQRMPVSAPMAKLERKKAPGFSWNPIIEWKAADVMAIVKRHNLALHEAYTIYGTSRVSCAYCIMSSEADMLAASTCMDNAGLYREMVALECESTFAFQGNRWLADVAPQLLFPEMRERVAAAKVSAIARQGAEARIPRHMLYSPGWPHVVPNQTDAELLADVRRDVALAVGIDIEYMTAGTIQERFEALIRAKKAHPVTATGSSGHSLLMFDANQCCASDDGAHEPEGAIA
jgi:3'-phosphoadenosine 5'-phosphosulfate sulfotransferase (PAPS reductase)/FAD synthetase